jgi:hypothetical protein
MFPASTAASWVIGRLPGQVVDKQRAELIRMLAKAGDLVVDVHCRSAVMQLLRPLWLPLVVLSVAATAGLALTAWG